MGHNWIIDVIADLKTFAQRNELPVLATELETVMEVAQAEMKSDHNGAPAAVLGEHAVSGRILTQG